MRARSRHVWVGFLEPQEFAVVEAWQPTIVEVDGEAAGRLASAMARMGAPYALDKDRDVVAGRLDDLRRRCHVCTDGAGHYVCADCQAQVLAQRLELSVAGGAL